MNPHRVAVGTVAAVLALLALMAMHALPMAAAHTDSAASAGGASAPAGASASLMPGMHVGHVDGMAMPGNVQAVSTAMGAETSSRTTEAAPHSTDGVPPHEHSLLHLCVAVLVVGLSLALAARFRRRVWAKASLSQLAPVRAVLTRDTGPPSLAGLCLLRC